MTAASMTGEQTLTVNDIGIHVRRGGAGPTLLFLHGSGGIPRWLPFFDRLAERYDVIVPDHPGFGRSDEPAIIKTTGDMAFFYLDLIEEMGLRDIHLVGNSLGGWIAAEIAIRDRSRLKSLTLISPVGIKVKDLPFGDSLVWSAQETIDNLFFDKAFAARISPPSTDEEIDQQLKNRHTTSKLAWSPRFVNPDLRKWLHRIKLPAHVVWGVEDRLVPRANADLWIESLPDARLTLLPDCGHLPHYEQADRTADAVLNFLGEDRT